MGFAGLTKLTVIPQFLKILVFCINKTDGNDHEKNFSAQ